MRKNALQILIPKFGLEGTVYLNALKDDKQKNPEGVVFTFNEEDHTQRCDSVIFHAFDPVTIRLSLDSSNVQHEKLVFRLVEPYIKGFSVELNSTDESSSSTTTGNDVEMTSATVPPPQKKSKKDKQKQKKK